MRRDIFFVDKGTLSIAFELLLRNFNEPRRLYVYL